MTLPNAHKGVQKLFIAELLQIIGVVLVVFAYATLRVAVGIGSQTQATAAAGGLAVGGLITLIGGAILPIVAIILTLVGLNQASKDEPDYMRKAFICAVIALILSALEGVGMAIGGGRPGFLSTLASLAEMVMLIYAIMGVSEVCQNISRQDVADMGPKILTIVAIAFVIAIIAGIIGHFIGGVAAVVSLIMMLVAYIVYIVFLGRATGALGRG
ncbi:MAG TPA: hypothetical protein DCP91_08130 [Eggerthellaceae bacterium]|nr:hypothetical protein [Eggerthellaceae bacterium]